MQVIFVHVLDFAERERERERGGGGAAIEAPYSSPSADQVIVVLISLNEMPISVVNWVSKWKFGKKISHNHNAIFNIYGKECLIWRKFLIFYMAKKNCDLAHIMIRKFLAGQKKKWAAVFDNIDLCQ